MDADAALETLRTWAQFTVEEGHSGGVDPEQAADAFCALDEWIAGGGFLPTKWARHQG